MGVLFGERASGGLVEKSGAVPEKKGASKTLASEEIHVATVEHVMRNKDGLDGVIVKIAPPPKGARVKNFYIPFSLDPKNLKSLDKGSNIKMKSIEVRVPIRRFPAELLVGKGFTTKNPAFDYVEIAKAVIVR